MRPAVYILASKEQGALYVGVTSDIVGEMGRLRAGKANGLASRRGVTRLVYMENCEDMLAAVAREQQLTRWVRAWKITLIEEGNPSWRDLAVDLGLPPLRRSIRSWRFGWMTKRGREDEGRA